MNICVVTTWPPYRDGVALYSAQLCTHLSKRMNVWVLANRLDGMEGCVRPGRGGLHVMRVWRRHSLTFPLEIFRHALKVGGHLGHVQHGWLLYGGVFSIPLFLAMLLLLRLSKPRVITMHTVIGRRARLHSNGLLNFLAKLLILFVSSFIVRLADVVIVHNKLMREALVRGYAPGCRGKVLVIPHGVRRPSYGNVRPPSVGDSPKILFLGFLRRSKGLEVLIRAFRRVLTEYPNARLFIVGGPHPHDRKGSSYMRMLKKITLHEGLEGHVTFMGFLDDQALDELVWASDIIILPYVEGEFYETSGSLARVADFHKPIICCRVPKFLGELRDGKECVMLPSYSAEELARAVLRVLEDEDLAAGIREGLRRWTRRRRWEIIAESHMKVYQTLLRGSLKERCSPVKPFQGE